MPISDILSCPSDQVETLVTHDDESEHPSWFRAKNTAMIELGQLGEMLGVGTYDELTAGFKLVGEPPGEGPWVVTLPVALTTKLATLSDEEVAAVCPRWATIEEFRGTAPVDGLASYLTKLRGFLQSTSGPYFLVNAL